MMNGKDFLRQLQVLAVKRRPEACLGCGFEHNCSTHGCAVIRAAADRLCDIEQSVADLRAKTQSGDSFSRDCVIEILEGVEYDGR